MNGEIDPKIPISMNITIASAQTAIEFWLQHAVLKPDVKVVDVSFDPRTHFTVNLDRTSVQQTESDS